MMIYDLNEATEKEVAIIFGRFNPPHKGHKAAWELASKSPIWYVGTNQSTHGPKDPLPFDVKIMAMNTIWPKVAEHIVAEQSWLSLAAMVYKRHGNVKLLCFTDEAWVVETIQKYNGHTSEHGHYDFSVIEQRPTPRLSSATELRAAVVAGDRKAFTKAAGVKADTKVGGVPYFDLVAKYLLPYQDAKKKPKAKKAEPVMNSAAPIKEAKKRTFRTSYKFPDGPVWVSDHMLDAIKDKKLDVKFLAKIVDELKTRYAQDLIDMDPVKFAVRRKSDRYGMAIAKELMPDNTYRYVLITADPTLKVGHDQPIIYFESQGQDDLNVHFHDILNPQLFSSSGKMSPLVREKLLKIAHDFEEFLGVKLPSMKDITVSGSNAAYSYTPSSDIDLHLVVDLPEADNDQTWRELFDAKKFQYNAQHDYKIKGFDVELYVQNANEPHVSQGIYSIVNDEWIKEPEKIEASFDEISTRSKYDVLKNLIRMAISTQDYKLASRLRHTIKKYRQVGLHTTGEFGPENLAFKALRTNGYIKKLYDLLNQLKDKEFSVENIGDEYLTELDMSPGSLQKFSATDAAKQTKVGFEFEMIVPNMIGTEERESEPDYDEDGYVGGSTLDGLVEDLYQFFRDMVSRSEIKRAVVSINDDIVEAMENDFQRYLRENPNDIVERYGENTSLSPEEITASIDDEDSEYDEVITSLRDEFYESWDNLDGALEDLNLTHYSDWDREFGFGWPYMTSSSSDEIDTDAMRNVADEIADAVGMKVKFASGYHAFKGHREDNTWYLETDSSIDSDESEGEGGLELISPPMPLEQALQKLDTVIDWMNGHGAKTDSSTGFHMGVSIPNMEQVDYIKLILFLGDKYVLSEFGRITNSYTRSALGKMETINAKNVLQNMPTVFDALRGGLNTAALKLIEGTLVPRNDKYTSVNIKDSYIEFRSAGGKYLEAIEKVKNTLLRYVRVMAIASNPEEAKNEYAKKLYKLLAGAGQDDKEANTVKYFAMYASGNLTKSELVMKLKQAQSNRYVDRALKNPNQKLGNGKYAFKIINRRNNERILDVPVWADSGEDAVAFFTSNAALMKRLPPYVNFTDVAAWPIEDEQPPEPDAGRWERYTIHAISPTTGQSEPAVQISARDRREATHIAFNWGRDNDRVVTGLSTDANESVEPLTELANKPYDYQEMPSSFNVLHRAVFENENGIRYDVAFLDSETEEGDQSVAVEFRAYTSKYDFKGTQKITKSGNAFRVFATIADIVAKFLAFNPEFQNINFTADKSEPSRVKLYDMMAKMMPKFIPSLRFVSIENDNKYKHYHFTLKSKSLKEHIEESNKPFVWKKEEPKQEFTEMQLACILGGHEYTGELK